MTEKQFKNVEEELDWGTVQYFTYNGKKINDNDLENLVNHLLNENEQLKHDATVLIQANQDYRRENEQLKSTIKEVTELLSNEVDLFSDKATEHDINAYIELKELDNKDAYYMAISTKKAIKMLKGDVE